MKITCTLGRIAPVPQDPKAELEGDRNSKRWDLDIEYDGKEPVKLEIKLLDYSTGKPIPGNGHLEPQHACLSRAAARALVYFPEVLDDKLFVVIEPMPTVQDNALAAVTQSNDSDTIHIRLRVDAVHSLMR